MFPATGRLHLNGRVGDILRQGLLMYIVVKLLSNCHTDYLVHGTLLAILANIQDPPDDSESDR